jgi:NADPH:quinone reductase-like Zn-dependent oxidoreductase
MGKDVDTTEKLVAIKEIEALRARFARCMDTKQWVEMEDTIAADCEFDARDGTTVTALWIGAADIVANIRRNLENAVSTHHSHMPEIEITSPTTARGIWAMYDILRFPGVPTVELEGYGHYHETYEKQADGKWRLKTYKLTRLRVDVRRSGLPEAAVAPRATRSDRTIKAARLVAYGSHDGFVIEEVPEPVAGPGEILIRVAGAAVNPIDVMLRRGGFDLFMPLAFPAQLGGDVSGVVEAVGEGVTQFKPGDRVMGMINPSKDGAYAEKIAAPAAAFVGVPDSFNLIDAAALPVGALTGIQLVELGAKVQPGQKVLITGAGGSVGRAAVYAAVGAGAVVYAGIRARSRPALEGLPIAGIVHLNEPGELAAAAPFDAIADTVGGRVAETLSQYIRPGGVLASVVSPMPLPPVGAPITSAPVWVAFDGPRLTRFVADLQTNGWSMPIAHRLPLCEVAKAHALQEAGGLAGKVVLVP